MMNLRLHSAETWVDCRLAQLNGKWIGSADVEGGPTLGLGYTAEAAMRMALQPFSGEIDRLLASGGFEARHLTTH